MPKKTAVPANSSGLPQRAAGVRAMTSWYSWGIVLTGSVMSVSINKGAMAFTWILNGANSIAIDLQAVPEPLSKHNKKEPVRSRRGQTCWRRG